MTGPHPELRAILGAALMGQKKHVEAQPLLVQGYEELRKRQAAIPPDQRGVVGEILEGLIELCEATGQKDRAEEYRKQRGSVKKPTP